MIVGAMPVGLSYPGAATVAGLVQLEGARAAWKLSLNFFLSYNYFSLLSYFFIAFSFLSRKSNVMVKCVTEVTQRLDVDVDVLSHSAPTVPARISEIDCLVKFSILGLKLGNATESFIGRIFDDLSLFFKVYITRRLCQR